MTIILPEDEYYLSTSLKFRIDEKKGKSGIQYNVRRYTRILFIRKKNKPNKIQWSNFHLYFNRAYMFVFSLSLPSSIHPSHRFFFSFFTPRIFHPFLSADLTWYVQRYIRDADDEGYVCVCPKGSKDSDDIMNMFAHKPALA